MMCASVCVHVCKNGYVMLCKSLFNLQRGLTDGPGRQGGGKCLDGSQSGDVDVDYLPAIREWHCPEEAEGWQ